tara:strand:- start:20855 stop:21289 length:435 start_codon:yes stop_codon:yes gene_type:complete
MKPFFVTILLCIGTICIAQQPNSISVNASFNGFHCDGKHGLCSIDNENNRTVANSSLLLINENTLSFTVHRSKLSEKDFQNIFNTTSSLWEKSKEYEFEIPERIPLNQSIINRLQSKHSSLFISPGTYPIKVTNDLFIITFNLE